MKKLVSLSLAIMLFSFVSLDNPLSKKERKYAVNLLKDTEKAVLKSAEGLSEAQLTFKSAPDKWSIEDNLKHIAVSEQMIRGMVDAALKQAPNPEKRTGLKLTDEEVVKNLEDRSTKIKTIDPMKPENSPFKSAEEALNSFKENREKAITFLNTTPDDLRNHVLDLPMGTYDAYQVILLMGAHSNRHTQQIEEVKSHPDFPKN